MSDNTQDFISYDWFGQERRLQDPVSRLNRELYHDIKEANDSLELAAKLEALGYDARRSQDLGFDSVFGLAQELFERSPRKPSLRKSVVSSRLPSLWQQVTSLLALMLSLRLLAGTFESFIAHSLGLFVWAVVGSLTLQLSSKRLNALQTTRVFSLLIFIAGLGIVVLVPSSSLLATLLALLWLAIIGNGWLERYATQSGVWSLLPLATACIAFLPVPYSVTILLLAGISLFLFIPYLSLRLGDSWWLLRSRGGQLLLALISAAALAWLFNRSIGLYSQDVAMGLLLTALVTVLAEWVFIWFRQQLGATLWRTGSRMTFQQDALRLKLFFSLCLLLIVAGLLIAWYLQLLSTAIVAFSLLGIALALSLPLLRLAAVIPAVLLALAILLILSGIASIWVLAGLIIFLGIGFLISLRQIESFGSYLL